MRKDASKSDISATEGQEQFRPIAGQVRFPFTLRLRDASIINVVLSSVAPSSQTTKTPSQDTTASTQASVSALPHKLSVSFAAVANGTPDTSKEVSVSA
jgi:hypothetical protein